MLASLQASEFLIFLIFVKCQAILDYCVYVNSYGIIVCFVIGGIITNIFFLNEPTEGAVKTAGAVTGTLQFTDCFHFTSLNIYINIFWGFSPVINFSSPSAGSDRSLLIYFSSM